MNDNQAAKALALVRSIANMTTPFDHDQVAAFLEQNPEHKGLDRLELQDEIHAEYPSDDAMEDAVELWELIAESRRIIGSGE